MSFAILDRYTRAVIFELAESTSIRQTAESAVAKGANLRGANLDKWLLVIPASRHVITVYPDRVSIGCHTRTLEKWLASYERIGAEEGYSTEQIAEYGDHLRRIGAVMEVLDSAAKVELVV